MLPPLEADVTEIDATAVVETDGAFVLSFLQEENEMANAAAIVRKKNCFFIGLEIWG
jgi:predicted regulator of Ras-like GTPase activity (Roadblock/LC7/MglB family)